MRGIFRKRFHLPYCDGIDLLNPLFRSERKAVETRPPSNPVEFDGVKVGIVKLFPYAEKFQSIAISQPVSNKVIGMLGILRPRDVREADKII